MKLKEKSRIKCEWLDYYHNFSNKRVEDVTEQLANKYGVPVSKIEIIKKYIQTPSDSPLSEVNVSSAILDSILDPQLLQKNYIKFLDDQFPNFDKNTFFGVDREVLNLIPNMDIFDTKGRKYDFMYIEGKNIFSFGDFRRDFIECQGVNLIHSNPENQG